MYPQPLPPSQESRVPAGTQLGSSDAAMLTKINAELTKRGLPASTGVSTPTPPLVKSVKLGDTLRLVLGVWNLQNRIACVGIYFGAALIISLIAGLVFSSSVITSVSGQICTLTQHSCKSPCSLSSDFIYLRSYANVKYPCGSLWARALT